MGLSAKNKEILFNPLSKDNPVIVQMLGICSALAVTVKLQPALLEAFALGNKPWESFLDGVGNGAGYGIILVVVAFVRELFGSGTLLGFRIIPQAVYDAGYVNNGLMIMPPMALILCAVIVWIHRARNKDLQEK